MKRFCITTFFVFTTIIVFTNFLQVEAYVLERDLSFGSVGEDVRELQRFLNKDSATIVAANGVGSVGNESNYFGAATRDAVVRFQSKYPDETYLKAGLAAPNGFVGSLTRQAINTRTGNYSSIRSGAGFGFVYDPDVSALSPVVVPKYGDPIYTSSDASSEAYRRDAAATLAQGRVAAIDAILRLSATTSVASTTASAVNIQSPLSGVSINTEDRKKEEDPTVMFVGPKTAEVGDRVNVFGVSIPSDLRIKIGSKTVRVKGITKDGLRAYFKVPRVSSGVYALEFTSKKDKSDFVPPFNETISIVDELLTPRVVSGPDILTSGETITLKGTNFNQNGETYLNGAFGKIKAIDSSSTEVTFELPLLKDMLKRDVVVPGGVIPQRSLPFVLSTPAGQTTFVAVVQLR